MSRRPPSARHLDLRHGAVTMSHGAGGKAMNQLIEGVFLAAFDNPALNRRNDQADIPLPAGRAVMTTDSYVVSPLFFPGGDIGALAVNGTVNDIAMAGAQPHYLSAGFILEEGLALADLVRVVRSMAEAARQAGVVIVTGDTKVVERGKGDGVFITTTGVGVAPVGVNPSADRARPGDAVVLSGSIGDHGVAVLAQREALSFETTILSDTAPLAGLVADMVAAVPDIHVLRDPTRGGLAATLNEVADQSQVGIVVEEAAIPVRGEVRAACELLGLDPLNIANEGKLVAICAGDEADRLVTAMRSHPLGRDAAVIGRVVEDERRFVQMRTGFGGSRLIDWLAGEPLPRIC
ncbi:MAG: hydrogenase expression/formation protein HypE [Rhodospirillaceae bacterium]|nr:hydrogenase expression/formation protein HypE [Rhodospirillaceae bacterium]